MKHTFDNLLKFIRRLPAIDLSAGDKSVSFGDNGDGLWWIKFSLRCDHALAWRHVQEMGFVLNYVSISERLPTVFMPVSPPPFLNGGIEFLSWVIESKIKEFTPDDCCKCLEGYLPNPVEDLSKWQFADNDDIEDCDDDRGSGVELTKYIPKEADKAADCGSIGGKHHWYNCDGVHSGCYNCGKIVIGLFWKNLLYDK